ncbi:MAG: hypothetical protein ACSLEM_05170 [Candidatus Malihini olakiniferum]
MKELSCLDYKCLLKNKPELHPCRDNNIE